MLNYFSKKKRLHQGNITLECIIVKHWRQHNDWNHSVCFPLYRNSIITQICKLTHWDLLLAGTFAAARPYIRKCQQVNQQQRKKYLCIRYGQYEQSITPNTQYICNSFNQPYSNKQNYKILTWSWKQLHTVPKLKICIEELNRLGWEFEINKQFKVGKTVPVWDKELERLKQLLEARTVLKLMSQSNSQDLQSRACLFATVLILSQR